MRFDKNGKFLRDYGKMGSGPEGEFMQPHGLAFDSKGRLFVADRSNNRIQILDAETYKTLDTWYQFSRLSGIFIDKNDMLYGADSESGSVNPPHGAWKRGIESSPEGASTMFCSRNTVPEGSRICVSACGSSASTMWSELVSTCRPRPLRCGHI